MAWRSEHFGATISGYAAGFLPLPLAVTGWLMYRALDSVQTGSTTVLGVLIAAIPAALLLGPYNCYRVLSAIGDAYAVRTAKFSAGFGVLGLVLMVLPFGFLLYLGWIGLIAGVALAAVTVPALARQMVLSKVATERMAERARLGSARPAG